MKPCLFETFFEINAQGRRVLICANQRFNQQYVSGSKMRWRCVKRNSGCRACVVTVDDVIVKCGEPHNHR
ncbi:hypothetical protein EVAR_17918_1 [Eumeta japonica]|uniref:FLYWCH-type domain-containing protein n=1 Tax=Eumeta variegata TaxID=151549 RepID=A0A4C1UYX2_EUMVA|nr:hypothetical protein EVAR_17918_1 [Eumeta japonica]